MTLNSFPLPPHQDPRGLNERGAWMWTCMARLCPQQPPAQISQDGTFSLPLSYPHRACLSAKVDTCLQVPHYSPEMGTNTKWEDRCTALWEVQDEKLGCSEQDQPLSCSRLLLQERCLTKVSQCQTHLAAALFRSFSHLPRPEADRPPWEHPQAPAGPSVSPQLLLQLTVES